MNMHKVRIDNFDLEQVAKSGQCFRWIKNGENTYNIAAFGREVDITQNGNEFTLSCDEDEWNNIWKDYLDIDTDYGKIAKLIEEGDDEHLKEAYRLGFGVRILKQDLWEIIVTFMISQNNNIKRITNSVELLCSRCGRTLQGSMARYDFPKPDEAGDEIFEDRSMGFGYRAAYLRELFEFARMTPDWLDNLKKMSYDEAMAELLKRKGIGKKVADCICLFGLHHVDAFPIDTHVKQLLNEYYKDGFDFERYKGVAGIIQQYLFYYELIKEKK